MKIIIYYKEGCPWSAEVMEFLKEHGLSFEKRETSTDEANEREVVEKSGQNKSPTLDIDGKILADTDVDQVSECLESLGVEV